MNNIFSGREQKVLLILRRKKMKLAEIGKVFYRPRQIPLNGQTCISNTVRSITKKCNYYKLPWTLTGIGGGRAGRTVWRINR